MNITFKRLRNGVISGLCGGAIFGLIIQFIIGAMPAIGALYGAAGVIAAGWVIHMFHSAVFGAIYGAIASTGAFRRPMENIFAGTGLGVAYGIILWGSFLVFVWPSWLHAVHFPMAPSLPFVKLWPFAGHLIYGFILGIVYASITNTASAVRQTSM
jgi:hypothetical protein